MSPVQTVPPLAAASTEATRAALARFGVGDVEAGTPAVTASAFASLPVPGVAVSARVDGDAGCVALGLPPGGARRLAAAMMGQDPSSIDDAGELSDLDRAALEEATTAILEATVASIGADAGRTFEPEAPQLRTLAAPADVAEAFGDVAAQDGVVTVLTVLGEPWTLVQVLPAAPGAPASVDLAGAAAPASSDGPAVLAPVPHGMEAAALGEALRDTRLRVWAEIGRARLPVGRVVGLPVGAVLELDRLADDPVDIFVNGRRYAIGRLVVDGDGEWAVRLESLLG